MTELLIVFVVSNGVQLMDIAGPADVFAEANTLYGKPLYRSVIVAERKDIRSSCGFRLRADLLLGDISTRCVDTMLVAGAPDAATRPCDPVLTGWLRQEAPRARRFGSICGGVFPLAETGLLDGQIIAAHWADVDCVRQRFPTVIVDADAIIREEGALRTAAGVSSGLDLALSLVREDLGERIARDVARQLVLFYKRPGGQLQYSRQRKLSPAGRSALQSLQRRIMQQPDAEYSVKAMAELVELERRQLTRLFAQETGLSPARWVEQTRLAIARGLLEDGRKPPKVVAAEAGFGSVRVLRRVFQNHLGVTPAEYRKRFGQLY
ncbi:helix-turn-helix domain-containing protein [Acetobacter sp. DmW_136]|uniref:GlxA family transcriptional regulator n=1 Tax=Acetobacter sp. DmW_136 TaxID=2591091 RepID=UPI00123C10C6|nr:helix-turn-helix domain-containing protein [Acetobacter sp. DmW_136]KAA8383786.1 helix-turn-helix domain-containing protein [Acetobacter sp. DmW_136]